ncbi:hypothetical protein P3T73_11910 [Kiritimatiellota bacterium B12222]|nr:hypothetical protein P3T73_11910 [Kiritimatiellota bacterium B12222]
MKKYPTILIRVLLAYSLSSSMVLATDASQIPDVRVGDHPNRVLEVLGEPTGFMESGDIGVYYYDLGRIEIVNNKVSQVDLISPAELTKRQEQEAEAREANRIEGEKLLKEITSDAAFATLSGTAQLTYWTQFMKDYPDVNIYVPYTLAKTEADKEAEAAREKAKIAELERRVLLAELEAKKATELAKQQRLINERNSYNYGLYPTIYYPQSYYRRRYDAQNRPPPSNRPPRPDRPHSGQRPGIGIGIQPGNGININVGVGRSRSSSYSSTTTEYTDGFGAPLYSENMIIRRQED